MKHSREFNIAFVGLKPGNHEFHYTVDDKFFERYGTQEFHNAEVDINLNLDKKTGLFLLHFDISGQVTIPCDRCGDPFSLKLWDEFDLVVKIIDDELVSLKSDEDAEVAYIGRSESLLDVADWIYEFVRLSVPMQHIHPDDEQGKSTCNQDALRYLENKTEEQTNNPLWNALHRNKNN